MLDIESQERKKKGKKKGSFQSVTKISKCEDMLKLQFIINRNPAQKSKNSPPPFHMSTPWLTEYKPQAKAFHQSKKKTCFVFSKYLHYLQTCLINPKIPKQKYFCSGILMVKFLCLVFNSYHRKCKSQWS